MNRGCRVEGRLTPTERPRARLLVSSGEEADQVESRKEPADDLFESRVLPVSKCRRLIGIEFGKLGLELRVDASRSS